jgi:hypothetical protein
VDDPAAVIPAIERARKQTEQGCPCLIEFITSADGGFSNYRALG